MDAFKRIVDMTKAAVPVATATADSAYKRGRLAVLTKVLHRVDESSDPSFVARKQASVDIERVQVEMHRRFDRVVDLLHAIGLELEAVTNLVLDFHKTLQVPTASAAYASPDDGDRMEALAETLRTNSVKLTLLAETAASTLKQSCTGIIGSSLNTLRVDVGKARAAVRESQVSMDLARADAIAAVEHLNVAESAFEDMRANGYSGKSLETFREAAETARRVAGEKEARAASKIASYRECLRMSTSQFDFAIDQVSMATWSCFNVFFTELGNVLKDGAPVADTISRAIRDLKNLQSIAKQLTRERRQRLDRERDEALLNAEADREDVYGDDQAVRVRLDDADAVDRAVTATTFFDTVTTTTSNASPPVGSSAALPASSMVLELDDIFGNPALSAPRPVAQTVAYVGTYSDPFATPGAPAPSTHRVVAAPPPVASAERPLTPRTLDFEEIFGR